ncbi:MAG: DUF192 domain-containing protein [Arenicellales bacterium]
MKIIIRLIIYGVLFSVVHTSSAQSQCVDATEGLLSMDQEKIALVNDSGQEVSLQVFVADDNYERASGFQHICPRVIDKVLILFRYDVESAGRFHMQNVHAPLDIAFFDADGVLISAMLMQTYTEDFRPLFGPGAPFQFALEARQGFFAEINVSAASSYLKISD